MSHTAHAEEINIQGLETNWPQIAFDAFMVAVSRPYPVIDRHLIDYLQQLNQQGTNWCGAIKIAVDVMSEDHRITEYLLRKHPGLFLPGECGQSPDQRTVRLAVTLSDLTAIILTVGVDKVTAAPVMERVVR
jgi:hypothetical protein